MATKNKTRPSCARVKVEIDLVAKLPQRVGINQEDDMKGEITFKQVQIHYDYMPKYCKECYLQGHNEDTYWSEHPKLHEE